MASLKFSSSIEHVCLQEWKLSASWLQGDFSAWTFTDTILLAVLLIPSIHHHPKCICLNLFHLPLLLALCSFLTCSLCSNHIYFNPLFSSTFSPVSPSSLSWNPTCCFFKRLVPLQAQWNITKLSPCLVNMHPRELHPEQIHIHTTMGYDLRFQQ